MGKREVERASKSRSTTTRVRPSRAARRSICTNAAERGRKREGTSSGGAEEGRSKKTRWSYFEEWRKPREVSEKENKTPKKKKHTTPSSLSRALLLLLLLHLPLPLLLALSLLLSHFSTFLSLSRELLSILSLPPPRERDVRRGNESGKSQTLSTTSRWARGAEATMPLLRRPPSPSPTTRTRSSRRSSPRRT